MIRAIIIDDEPPCIRNLSALLQRHCPQVSVIATCQGALEGLKCIRQHEPDLVFLDVEMPVMNGFDLLSQLNIINFHLVFTTSYDEYALKAFKVNAVDYLLKPVDREDLVRAIEKVEKKSAHPLTDQIQNLLKGIYPPEKTPGKITVPTSDGLQFIPVDTIIHCESDDNYTWIIMKNEKKLLISVTLGSVEAMLQPYDFVRVHRSFLINRKEIEKFTRKDGGFLVMSNGTEIPLSRYKKEELLKMFTNNM